MTPIFDRSTGILRNAKGVSIRAADYGGVGGVRYLDNGLLKEMGGYTAKMIHYFKEFGYEEGVCAFSITINNKFITGFV